MKIKVGDSVKVTTGAFKNSVGNVLKVKSDAVYVSGVNVKSRSQKHDPARGITSGYIQKEGPIHISNVVLA